MKRWLKKKTLTLSSTHDNNWASSNHSYIETQGLEGIFYTYTKKYENDEPMGKSVNNYLYVIKSCRIK